MKKKKKVIIELHSNQLINLSEILLISIFLKIKKIKTPRVKSKSRTIGFT